MRKGDPDATTLMAALAGRIRPARRLARRLAVALLVAALLADGTIRPAAAQIAVFDSAVFAQAALEVARTIQLVQLTIQDLAPFTQLTRAMQVLAALRGVMGRVQVIADKIRGRSGLWGSSYPINNLRELGGFRSWANGLCREASQDALQAQDLLNDAILLVEGVAALLDSLAELLGTVASMQMANTYLASVAGKLATMQGMISAAQEATLCNQWRRLVSEQSIYQLHRNGIARSRAWLDQAN